MSTAAEKAVPDQGTSVPSPEQLGAAQDKSTAEEQPGLAQDPGRENSSPTGKHPVSAFDEASTGILPPEHWVEQDARNNDDDHDSTLGDDDASSTASLTSSIVHYRTIHGRTFHSERGNAQYWASNDPQQNESQDINHHALTLALNGKLYLAPLKDDIQNALDVGTGTGIWAIDFADEFPRAKVVGTDISPIQPGWVPPNLVFEIEDCTEAWSFPRNHFDYVHIRWLLGSIDSWTALFKNAFLSLKPGGWLESFEMSAFMESDDGSVTDQTAMGQWGKFYLEGERKFKRSFTVVQNELQRKSMEAAGFVDIQEHNMKMPLGAWPKDEKSKNMGRYAQLVLEQDASGYILFIANTLGWTMEEVMTYSATLRREIRSRKYHGYYKQKIVWGRKPELPGKKA